MYGILKRAPGLIILHRLFSADPVNATIDVPLDKNILANFSEPMDPVSIGTSFTLANTSLGGTPIVGTITYS